MRTNINKYSQFEWFSHPQWYPNVPWVRYQYRPNNYTSPSCGVLPTDTYTQKLAQVHHLAGYNFTNHAYHTGHFAKHATTQTCSTSLKVSAAHTSSHSISHPDPVRDASVFTLDTRLLSPVRCAPRAHTVLIETWILKQGAWHEYDVSVVRTSILIPPQCYFSRARFRSSLSCSRRVLFSSDMYEFVASHVYNTIVFSSNIYIWFSIIAYYHPNVIYSEDIFTKYISNTNPQHVPFAFDRISFTLALSCENLMRRVL